MVNGIGLMLSLLKQSLGQIVRELGARPAEVPGMFRKIRVKGMPFRVSRLVAPQCCNVAVMEMNALVIQLFTIIITPFDKHAPLVNVDIVRMLGKTEYLCAIYEFSGSHYASFYEDIRCTGLKEVPVSENNWYSHLETFSKHFSKGAFQCGKEQYEHFIAEFIDRTCRIYREADVLGAPGDNDARDCQIRHIRDYAHGLIEKGGVSTDAFKAAMSQEQLVDFYDTVLFRAEE